MYKSVVRREGGSFKSIELCMCYFFMLQAKGESWRVFMVDAYRKRLNRCVFFFLRSGNDLSVCY